MGGDRLAAHGDLERRAERLTAELSSLDGDPQQELLRLLRPSPLRGAHACIQTPVLKPHFLQSLRFLEVAHVPWGGIVSLILEVPATRLCGKKASHTGGRDDEDNDTSIQPLPFVQPIWPLWGN